MSIQKKARDSRQSPSDLGLPLGRNATGRSRGFFGLRGVALHQVFPSREIESGGNTKRSSESKTILKSRLLETLARLVRKIVGAQFYSFASEAALDSPCYTSNNALSLCKRNLKSSF